MSKNKTKKVGLSVRSSGRGKGTVLEQIVRISKNVPVPKPKSLPKRIRVAKTHLDNDLANHAAQSEKQRLDRVHGYASMREIVGKRPDWPSEPED